MELKLLAFVVLIVSGVVFADDEYDACEENEVKACVASYREYASDDPSEKQACRQVKAFISCMKEGLRKCGYGDDLDEDFGDLESLYKENCADDHELTDDSKECFKNNENYISACLTDTMVQMAELMTKYEDDFDENIVLCFTFSVTSHCVINRITEKCGSEAGQEYEEANGEPDEEIKEACFAESTLEFLAKLLLEERKKRR